MKRDVTVHHKVNIGAQVGHLSKMQFLLLTTESPGSISLTCLMTICKVAKCEIFHPFQGTLYVLFIF